MLNPHDFGNLVPDAAIPINKALATGDDVAILGNWVISSSIEMKHHGQRLIGRGHGGRKANGTYVPGRSSLTWNPDASPAYMVIWGNQVEPLIGGGIHEMDILGSDVATRAIWACDVREFRLQGLHLGDTQEAAIWFGNNHTTVNDAPCGNGTMEDFSIYQGGPGFQGGVGHGIVIAGGAQTSGVFSIKFGNGQINHNAGAGIIISHGDSCSWTNVNCFTPISQHQPAGVLVNPPTPQTAIDNHVFTACDVGLVWMATDPGIQDIFFLPYERQNGEPLPGGPFASHCKIVAMG